MTKKAPRIFISLLLILLCIGILPVSAFASSGDYPDDTLPAAESSAADTQETKQIGTVTTNGGNLNVRTGAGLDNTAFTQLPNGTVVDVIGRDGESYAGRTIWSIYQSVCRYDRLQTRASVRIPSVSWSYQRGKVSLSPLVKMIGLPLSCNDMR